MDGSSQNEVSIRYCRRYEHWDIKGGYKTWILFENAYDYDYDSYYQHDIAEIKYCPFCGIELEV